MRVQLSSGVSIIHPLLFHKLKHLTLLSFTVIAFLFTFYLLSFFFDLRPRARTKGIVSPEELQEMRERRRGRSRFTRFMNRSEDRQLAGNGGTVNGGA